MQKNTRNVILAVVGGAVVFLLILLMVGIGMRNGLVRSQNHVDNAWADVQSVYQRRIDTIPNFAKTAQFSAEFQIKLQERVASLREGVDQLKERDVQGLQSVDNKLAALFVAVRAEAVPTADTSQLTELNAQIESIERAINHQRDAYNQACTDYRNATETFPRSMFGFDSGYCKLFKAQAGADKAPEVNLNLQNK